MGDGKKASGFVQAICEQALRLLRLREASAVEFLGVEQGGANREESDRSLQCYDLRLMIFELRRNLTRKWSDLEQRECSS